MKGIKFGLKLWSTNTELIEGAQELVKNDLFDYIELTYVPNSDLNPFKDRNLDYILHFPTLRHDVNFADKDDMEKNLKLINEGLTWAKSVDAKYAIIHPGFGELKDVKIFLKKVDDERILIENMPKLGLRDGILLGYSTEDIKKLTNNKFGFCLDLNHAIKASISQNKDYKKNIKNLSELEPEMFHVADGRLDFEKDEHLAIGKGEYDWKFLMDVIKNSSSRYVTLETPRDTLDDDIKNIKRLKKFLD